MRILVYADLQATLGHERSFTTPTKTLQYWRVERFFDQIEEIYDRLGCQALWDLGDTTDDRSAIPVPILDLLCARLERFDGKWNLKLVGNHEQYLRDTSVNAGKVFRRYFKVIETMEVLTFGKVNIFCLSFHDDLAKMTDFLRNERCDNSILLGHFPVAGCQMSAGTSLTGVPRNLLEFVNIGLLGHVHLPQQVGERLHYVGSPFQQHWGEAGEKKRIGVLDLDSDGTFKMTWHPLEGLPIYRQVSFEEFSALASADSEDRYKVVLRNLAETEAFYAHPLASRADEAVYDYTPETQPGQEGSEAVISNSKEDLMRRYLQLNPPSERSLEIDPEEMLRLGEQISRPV